MPGTDESDRASGPGVFREMVRLFCDTTEMRSGIPDRLAAAGVTVVARNLRKTSRRAAIEQRSRGRWRAARADYLFVARDGRILAAVERKTWPGMWRDLCTRDRDRKSRLKS